MPNPDRLAHMVIGPDDFPMNNRRVIYDTWTASGKPTHGYVLLYKNEDDLNTDSSPWTKVSRTLEFTTTYDSQDRPTTYIQSDT